MLGADPQDLAGIDLMPERIERARRRVPNADLRVGSAAELPWADESFDIVSQMLVFENIFDPALKQAAASEMLRITRPGGGILWFDIRVRNPNNPQIKGLPKKEIKALFPGCEMTIRPAVLAPPLSRWIAPRSWWAAETLNLIPLLRTHYTALIRKPGR
jgi:ubiquinone/menaquinone biosynthesis C-methylase UbiE